LQYKRLFTAPRTKGAEDKKPRRMQRKEKTEEFSHRFSQINTEVKEEKKD
jgi:hypothetical protein